MNASPLDAAPAGETTNPHDDAQACALQAVLFLRAMPPADPLPTLRSALQWVLRSSDALASGDGEVSVEVCDEIVERMTGVMGQVLAEFSKRGEGEIALFEAGAAATLLKHHSDEMMPERRLSAVGLFLRLCLIENGRELDASGRRLAKFVGDGLNRLFGLPATETRH